MCIERWRRCERETSVPVHLPHGTVCVDVCFGHKHRRSFAFLRGNVEVRFELGCIILEPGLIVFRGPKYLAGTVVAPGLSGDWRWKPKGPSQVSQPAGTRGLWCGLGRMLETVGLLPCQPGLLPAGFQSGSRRETGDGREGWATEPATTGLPKPAPALTSSL